MREKVPAALFADGIARIITWEFSARTANVPESLFLLQCLLSFAQI
jgi:hypothetical protein